MGHKISILLASSIAFILGVLVWEAQYPHDTPQLTIVHKSQEESPKIDNKLQHKRDNLRKRILESELEQEEYQVKITEGEELVEHQENIKALREELKHFKR